MRQPLKTGLVVIVAYLLWTTWMSRSAAVALEPSGYTLTYTMTWGWGMDEKISLSRFGGWWSRHSSEWFSVWDKPYNSGASVYRSADGGSYFFAVGYKLWKFELSSGALTSYCDSKTLPYTSLGTQIATATSYRTVAAIDPGAQSREEYVEPAQQSGPVPASPPDSKYYANLKYLGRFGLVRSGGRGNEVRFVPANHAPEPRLGLFANCG
ncbi:hypothetical protein [Bradyrhizobium sp. SYSU BS000235]|uniref:hypothetical protein n=1 Tax=Bradyrhizobium sp. SYSU BS000235 TaxID=3411332 RepID=UPI003C711004